MPLVISRARSYWGSLKESSKSNSPQPAPSGLSENIQTYTFQLILSILLLLHLAFPQVSIPFSLNISPRHSKLCLDLSQDFVPFLALRECLIQTP